MLIMLNKWILSNEGFDYPILLASLGMLFSGIVSGVLIHVFHVETPRDDIDAVFWTTNILPIGLVSALCLATGNVPYMYLSVSYIQILKALSPVFALIVLSICGLEKPTWRLSLSVFVIAAGTGVAAVGEIQFSWFGTILMLASEILEAIKLAAMQHLLGSKQLSSLHGTYYLCPATFLWLTVGVCFTELHRFTSNNGFQLMALKPHMYIIAASLGVAVNYLSVGVIKNASSLWLKVLGQVKNAALVYGSTLVFGNIVTFQQYLGYGFSLVGFGLYSHVKAVKQPEDSKIESPRNPLCLLPIGMPITCQASVDSFAQLGQLKKNADT